MESWNAEQKNITRRKFKSAKPQLFGCLPAPNTASGPQMGGMNVLVPTAPPVSGSERRAWSAPDQLCKISQPEADNNKNFKTRGKNRSHGRGNSVKQFQNRRVNAAGEDELNEEDDVLDDRDEPYQLTGSFNQEDDDYVNSPETENPKIDENNCTNTIFTSQPDDEKTVFE
ncbi:hypothetical protein K3495_g12419 [Podosphaera aphanis]|nr:hypothetical protein K3495_g12419 [Podosphaera aphanis]